MASDIKQRLAKVRAAIERKEHRIPYADRRAIELSMTARAYWPQPQPYDLPGDEARFPWNDQEHPRD